MKTKEELNALKEEVEAVNKTLAELNKEDLEQVSGGSDNSYCVHPRGCICNVARMVICGDWGNGEERKRRLKAAGYDYDLVMKVVNMMLNDTSRHPKNCYLYD